MPPVPPHRRPFPLKSWFPADDSFARRAWDRSRAAIDEIARRAATLDDPALAGVAISGSLGRMEGRDDSDWDVIFLLHGDRDSSPERFDQDWLRTRGSELWERLDPEGFRRPKLDGIFARPIALTDLADPANRGRFDESPARFGKRIQSLLDCQSLLGDPNAGPSAALSFYGVGESNAAAGRDGVYLLNDLIRYHRSLCVMTRWLPDSLDEFKRSRLRLKLRVTRFLNYLGLLLPLTQGIDRGDVAGSLAPALSLTPLERVLSFAGANADSEEAARRLCLAYEGFLALLESDDATGGSPIADEFARGACDLLRAQPFLKRGPAADLLLL